MRFRISLADLLLLVALTSSLFIVWKTVRANWKLGGAKEFWYAATISPNGKLLARSTDEGLGLFCTSDGKLLMKLPYSPRCIAFAADSKWFAYHWENQIVVVSLVEKAIKRRIAAPFSVDGLALAAGGQVAAAGFARAVYLYDAAGTERLLPGLNTSRITFSPDGRWLATGQHQDGILIYDVVIWDSASGNEITRGRVSGILSDVVFAGKTGLITASHSYWSGGRTGGLCEKYDVAKRPVMAEAVNHFDIFMPGGGRPRLSQSGMYMWEEDASDRHVWDLTTKEKLLRLQGGERYIAMSVSERSHALLANDRAGTLTRWSLRHPNRMERISGLTLYSGEMPGLHIPWKRLPIGALVIFATWLICWLARIVYCESSPQRSDTGGRGYLAAASFYSVACALLVQSMLFNEGIGEGRPPVVFLAVSLLGLMLFCGSLASKRVRSQVLFASMGGLVSLATAGAVLFALLLMSIPGG